MHEIKMKNDLSTNQAKKRLGCSAQTIRNLIRSGKISALQLENGHFQIQEASLQNYLQNQGKITPVAKDAKPKTKILHNTTPKLAGNQATKLAEEVTQRYGNRPEWPHLYQTLLQTNLSLDGISLECLFRSPDGGFESFNRCLAYSLPDDSFQFEEELWINWHKYDLEVEAANHYLQNEFRWWIQLEYQEKIIIRSRDENSPVAGLTHWIENQDRSKQEETNELLQQTKIQEQVNLANLAICGSLVGLGLLLGLSGRPTK